MNHTPAYILAQYLIGEGLLDAYDASSGDWPVYTSNLPDGDNVENNIAACIDSAPVKDGRYLDGENIFHYGVQILLRSIEYNAGYAKSEDLETALENVDRASVTISGTTYRLDNVSATSGIIPMGQEEGTKRRGMFSMNFLVTLKEI